MCLASLAFSDAATVLSRASGAQIYGTVTLGAAPHVGFSLLAEALPKLGSSTLMHLPGICWKGISGARSKQTDVFPYKMSQIVPAFSYSSISGHLVAQGNVCLHPKVPSLPAFCHRKGI